MRYETKSQIAYTIAACILITMIIAWGIVMYCLIKQGILPVNKETLEAFHKIDGNPLKIKF